jgi:hypothetical protein
MTNHLILFKILDNSKSMGSSVYLPNANIGSFYNLNKYKKKEPYI